jgi:hypothetical protein
VDGSTITLLGFPADARLLIVNTDDFGMYHAHYRWGPLIAREKVPSPLRHDPTGMVPARPPPTVARVAAAADRQTSTVTS